MIPRIIYSDLAKIPYAYWGNGQDPAYPVTKLFNYLTTSHTKSLVTTANQMLVLDYGQPVTFSDIVIDGHNLGTSQNASCILIASSTVGFTSDVTTVAVMDILTDDTFHQTFEPVTKRFWGIKFVSSNTQPYLANVFLSNAVVFTTSYDSGFKAENLEYNINYKTSLSGVRRGSKNYKGRLVYELKFSYQDNTLRTAFQAFTLAVQGSTYPFYFISADGVIRYMNIDSNYIPVTTMTYGYNSIDTLTMKTNNSEF